MLCNKTKNIVASLIIVICFIFFLNSNIYSSTNNTTPPNSPRFIISKILKNKDTIIVNGLFLNGSKDRIYNFKNVKLSIKTKNDILIKTITFNDNNLKEINLTAGNFVKWKFFLKSQNFNSVNVNNIKVSCDFNYLTEFNNSFDSGIHVFYNNSELQFKSKPYLDKNTGNIYIPTEMLLTLNRNLRIKDLNRFIKNNENNEKPGAENSFPPSKKDGEKDNPPPKNKNKMLSVEYISLNDLNNLLFPKYHVYCDGNNDYYIIVIYR